MEKELASGNAWNLDNIKNYENAFKEGDTGSVVISLRSSVPSFVVDGINSSLKKAGIFYKNATQSHSSSAKLRVPFKKSIAPLALVAAIIVAAIVVWVLVTSWKLMQDMGVNPATVMPFLLLGVVILVGYFFLKARPSISVGTGVG